MALHGEENISKKKMALLEEDREHQDLYLDMENALLEKITELEKKIFHLERYITTMEEKILKRVQEESDIIRDAVYSREINSIFHNNDEKKDTLIILTCLQTSATTGCSLRTLSNAIGKSREVTQLLLLSLIEKGYITQPYDKGNYHILVV